MAGNRYIEYVKNNKILIFFAILIVLLMGAIVFILGYRSTAMDMLGIPQQDNNSHIKLYYEVVRNVIMGIITVIGLGFAVWRTHILSRQTADAENKTEIAKQNLEHDQQKDRKQSQEMRFSEAVTQLSSEHLSVRLGGIFTLSALKDEDDLTGDGALYKRCMHILCAFIRNPYNPKTVVDKNKKRLRSDVQEAVQHVTDRTDEQCIWEEEKKIIHDLSHAVLQYGNFYKYNFSRMMCDNTNFSNACCEGANFSGAEYNFNDFKGATLTKATGLDIDKILQESEVVIIENTE